MYEYTLLLHIAIRPTPAIEIKSGVISVHLCNLKLKFKGSFEIEVEKNKLKIKTD